MALISLRQLLDHAAEHNYGVPAFNVNNLEQIRAIMEAADEANSPVILQASAGARKYAGSNFLKHLIQAAIEEFPHIPIVMHQDTRRHAGLRACHRQRQFLQCTAKAPESGNHLLDRHPGMGVLPLARHGACLRLYRCDVRLGASDGCQRQTEAARKAN